MDVMGLINVNFEVTARTFRTIIEFIRRYVNNSYQIALYLNMNRIIKAETDINECTKETLNLLQVVNFLRFKNAAATVHAGLKWLKKARVNL